MRALFGPRHNQDIPIGQHESHIPVTYTPELETVIDFRTWRNDAISPTVEVKHFVYRKMKLHWRRCEGPFNPEFNLKTEVLVPHSWSDDRVMEQIFYTFFA